MSGKSVRIGGFSGFWGDYPDAAVQLARQGGKIDYLIGDYLAEVTMCILARAKAKGGSGGAGEGGYVKDFLKNVWKPLMKEALEKNIKIVTNAGGMNPAALKAAIEAMSHKAGLPVPVVGCVMGDDLSGKINELREDGKLQGFCVDNLKGETEGMWRQGKEMVMSSNAYTGAREIAHCLSQGAQIVITGRCVDSALVLGPLAYEFGWSFEDYNLMSAGSLAGHVIECGCQCTGGNFTDWELSVKDGWDNVGFPIAECTADGSFTVTKPQGTGGLVSVNTVKEQIVYEIGDPSRYLLPDVACDWTQVRVTQVGPHRVHVEGARGAAPSPFYKIGTTTMRGYKTTVGLLITGVDAARKALAVGAAHIKRCQAKARRLGMGNFTRTHVEAVGSETTYGRQADPRSAACREVMLRIAVAHPSPKALKMFLREVPGNALATAPGISGSNMGGRSTVTPLIGYYSTLIMKNLVPLTVLIGARSEAIPLPTVPTGAYDPPKSSALCPSGPSLPHHGYVTIPLIALCLARSGDKGDCANIGLICRRPEYVGLVREQITSEAVRDFLPHLLLGSVVRYEMPGLLAFNFLATRALGGGGVVSLNLDNQGKTYGQKVLGMPIKVPPGLARELKVHPLQGPHASFDLHQAKL